MSLFNNAVLKLFRDIKLLAMKCVHIIRYEERFGEFKAKLPCCNEEHFGVLSSRQIYPVVNNGVWAINLHNKSS